MFDISLLWVWIVTYIICLILWVTFRKYKSFLRYILSMIGATGCIFSPIAVGGILGEKFNSIFAMIPSVIMFCLFFATTRDDSDEFFSLETLKNFFKFILATVFLGLLVLSFVIKSEEGFFNEILFLFLAAFSIIGLFITISSLQNDK